MSGRFRKGIVVVVSPLKIFGDHFHPRDKICEKPIFLLQIGWGMVPGAILAVFEEQKSFFRKFCREDESGRQTFLGAKQQPQCPSETSLTSG